MNKTRSVTWALAVAAAFAATAAIPGCELIVSFDRAKISVDGGFADVTVADGPGGGDATQLPDSAAEAAAEAGNLDAARDGGSTDSAGDAGDAGNADAPVDTGADVRADTGADAVADVAAETGSDSAVETGSDAPSETGSADAPVEASDDGGGDAIDDGAAADGD
jgi:hypothetical protein